MKKFITLVSIFFFSSAFIFSTAFSAEEAEKEILNSISQFYVESSKEIKTFSKEEVNEWLTPYQKAAQIAYSEGKVTETEFGEFTKSSEKIRNLDGKELSEKLTLAANNMQTLMTLETAKNVISVIGLTSLVGIVLVPVFIKNQKVASTFIVFCALTAVGSLVAKIVIGD